MSVDIFFCTMPGREDLTERCFAAWKASGISPYWVTPQTIGVRPEDFQKMRRVYADEKAGSQYYIVADDDCEPPSDGAWIYRAVGIMEHHPEFAILSLWPSNATIARWTPEDYRPLEDEDVLEHISVGGIRLCQKGMLSKGWPSLAGKHYDMAQCAAVRRNGQRVGYLKHLQMVHLGEGRSSLISL